MIEPRIQGTVFGELKLTEALADALKQLKKVYDDDEEARERA